MILVKQHDVIYEKTSNMNTDLNVYQNIDNAYNYYLTLVSNDTKHY